MKTKKVEWLDADNTRHQGAPSAQPSPHHLAGIDGLYFHDNTLLAVQNGSSPERVIAFHLDRSGKKVVSEEVIERATPLGDPTHGVVVGNDFYYIADSGWSALDEHGNPKPDVKQTSAAIMKFDLGALH